MNANSSELLSNCRSLALRIGFVSLLSTINFQLSTFAQGTAFTYQGRLNDGSSPVNGNYDMQFYLRNAATGGSPVGNTNTVAPVPASNGLFTVTLDFGPGIFAGSPLWLEIGIRTNGSLASYTTLSPRQPLTPSPYALFAPTAGGVTNGGISSGMLADGAVTTAKLADGAVTSQQLADTVALGGTNVAGRLDLYRTTDNGISIQLLGSIPQLRMFGTGGQQKLSLDASPGWGELNLLNNNSPSQFAAILTANGTGGGSLTLNSSNGLNRAVLFGANTGGSLNLFDGSGTNNVTLGNFGGGLLALNGANGLNRATLGGLSSGGQMNLYNASNVGTVSMNSAGNSWLTGGNLGIGTTAAVQPLHVRQPQAIALLETTASANGSVLELQNSGTANFLGAINFLDGVGSVPVQVGGFTNGDLAFRAGGLERARLTAGGVANFLKPSGASGVTLDPGSAQISTYGGDGQEQIRLWGNSYGEVLLHNSLVGNQIAVQLTANGTGGGVLSLNDTNAASRALLAGYNTGGWLSLSRPDGTVTISLNADDGTGSGLITTSVLQITGGADLSEQFDVRDSLNSQLPAPNLIQPGMVVCIDPENPGQLVVSTKPYDRTVAGIVSGAGGVNPGMLMGHHGTVADGKHPVALTGRVYCLAETSTGSIRPGDLLTTSTRPGHAMRVADPSRAQGAILGKAMSSLQKDEGLVLVLVSLQ
jgi:hypothetical protein